MNGSLVLIIVPLLLAIIPALQEKVPLDTGFTILLLERSEYPPGIEAEIQTTSTYPCAGFRVQSEIIWYLDTVTIALGGLVRPSPCFSGMERATGNIYLGNLGKGTFILRVRYRGHEDLHLLHKTKAGIEMKPRIDAFTTVNTK